MNRTIWAVVAGVVIVPLVAAMAYRLAVPSGPAPQVIPVPAVVPVIDRPVRVAPSQGKAPRRDFEGLEVGRATAADVDAWLAARSLACASAPNPNWMSVRWDCTSVAEKLVFEGRPHAGPVKLFVLSRPDQGALDQIDVTRQYSAEAQGLADYDALVAAIAQELGPPAVIKGGDIPVGTMFRWMTAWSFDEIEVRVVAFRAVADYVTVSEQWTVPDEGPVPPRVRTPFDGKPNPHLEETTP